MEEEEGASKSKESIQNLKSKNVTESNIETEALSVLSLLCTVNIQSQERRHRPLFMGICVFGGYI